MKKDYFILVIIIISGIFSLFLIGVLNFDSSNNSRNYVDAENIESAKNLTRQRVLDSYQYKEYEGSDLRLIGAIKYDCDGCWTITYEYKINNEIAPANFDKVKMIFEFENKVLENTTYKEIVEGEEKVYCTTTQRDVGACIELYDPVCGYFDEDVQCIKEPCAQEYSNSCFACNDEKVLYYIKGSC